MPTKNVEKSNHYLIGKIKKLLYSKKLKTLFRKRVQDFTRDRKMKFPHLLLFMMSMVKKSLQLELCNFMENVNSKHVTHITNSAYNQARMKLDPEIFKYIIEESNNEFYSDNDERVKLWNGFRLLACDGSFFNVPFTPKLVKKFGVLTNQHITQVPNARCSILYDLENEMILNGTLSHCSMGEREILVSQLDVIKKSGFNELIILDRGYPSFDLVHEFNTRKINFLIRVQSNFSNDVKAFIESNETDTIIELQPSKKVNFLQKIYTRKSTITVRLVKVILDSGEVEILMTSLMDNEKYPVTIFKELYFKRWGIETLYDKLKNKLKIEQFTGYTETSIMQDFYCTLFLSNIQSLLVSEANDKLKEQGISNKKYEYKVNTNLSIGFMKTKIIDLFMKDNDAEFVLKNLEELFLKTLIPIRPNRSFTRNTQKFRIRAKPPVTKNHKNVL